MKLWRHVDKEFEANDGSGLRKGDTTLQNKLIKGVEGLKDSRFKSAQQKVNDGKKIRKATIRRVVGAGEFDPRVFDFTEVESRIVLALKEHGPLTVSKLGRIARIPRTSGFSALLRLQERDFVRRVTKGQRKTWKLNQYSKLFHAAREGIKQLDPHDVEPISRETSGGINPEDIGIKVFRGKRQISRAIVNITSKDSQEAFYTVYGHRHNVSQETLQEDRGHIHDLHNRIKKASSALGQGIQSESRLKTLRKRSAESLRQELNKNLFASIVSDQYLDFGLDLFIFKNCVILTSMEADIVILIENKAIARLFNAMAVTWEHSGEKVNMNKEIWGIIEEKEKA